MDMEKFKESGLSILVLKGEKVLFSSDKEMLKPLIEAIGSVDMHGATVYDKIVGRAAMLLFVKAKVKEVFALVASKTAVQVAEQYEIPFVVEELTERIINRKGDDICPMEKKSECLGPEEFYANLTW
jgi:hypothetical protein